MTNAGSRERLLSFSAAEGRRFLAGLLAFFISVSSVSSVVDSSFVFFSWLGRTKRKKTVQPQRTQRTQRKGRREQGETVGFERRSRYRRLVRLSSGWRALAFGA